jgi:branched-chain amino acid aminotransferase
VAPAGYQQILWLFGPDHQVTEVGTMNCFIYWTNEQDELELVTPALTDGTILPGVTRDSILELGRNWNEFKVSERTVTMKQLTRALGEGRVHEMFGAGTAAVVSPIKAIHYNGQDLQIPLDKKDPTSLAGPLAMRFWEAITMIQYGEIQHEWSVKIA